MYYVEFTFGHSQTTDGLLPDSQIALAEQKALTLFAECFGGGQCYHALGSYRGADNRLVIELCTIIRAYTLEVKEHWDALCTLAHDIARLLAQECVLVNIVELNGLLALIKPE